MKKQEKHGAAVPSTSGQSDTFEDKILSAISAINAKMDRQDQRMQVVASRMDSYDEYWAIESGQGDATGYGPQGELVEVESSPQFEGFTDCESGQEQDNSDRPEGPGTKATKLSVDRDENANMFKRLGKKFMSTEVCGNKINQDLADNVNYLFRNGIEEERYKDLIKDEENPRPENCDALIVVKVNQLVWDAVTPAGRTRDLKMQNMETSVVKAATILSKAVEVMGNAANAGGAIDGEFLAKLIEDSNDVLALLGHTNKQINVARKDFLRKEINSEYSHLCNHNLPVTKFLFGDDVSQSAKQIEDCSKLSNKMFSPRPMRGWPRQRSGRLARFRTSYPYGRGRGRAKSFGDYSSPGSYNSPAASTSGSSGDTKNSQRRGTRPYRY